MQNTLVKTERNQELLFSPQHKDNKPILKKRNILISDVETCRKLIVEKCMKFRKKSKVYGSCFQQLLYKLFINHQVPQKDLLEKYEWIQKTEFNQVLDFINNMYYWLKGIDENNQMFISSILFGKEEETKRHIISSTARLGLGEYLSNTGIIKFKELEFLEKNHKILENFIEQHIVKENFTEELKTTRFSSLLCT